MTPAGSGSHAVGRTDTLFQQGETMAEPTKPERFLLRGSTITVDQLMKLYRRLTGREPTPEDMARAKAKLDRFSRQAPPAQPTEPKAGVP
jgi:hypothetical protein